MEFDPFGQHQTFHDSVARRRGVPLRHFSCRVSECGGGCLSGGGTSRRKEMGQTSRKFAREILPPSRADLDEPAGHPLRTSVHAFSPADDVSEQTHLSREPWPCDPAAETAIQPKIRFFKADFPTGLLIRRIVFFTDTGATADSHKVRPAQVRNEGPSPRSQWLLFAWACPSKRSVLNISIRKTSS